MDEAALNGDRGHAYESWEQVSGHFDGDGSLKVHAGVYSLTLEASWAGQDLEQLLGVKVFLGKQGVHGNIGRYRSGPETYYELGVPESGNLLLLLKKMLTHVIKKKSQIATAIDYLEKPNYGNSTRGDYE